MSASLVGTVLDAAREHGARCAIEDAAGSATYGELAARIAAVADALGAVGVARGERVALLAARGVESSVAFHGVMARGAACVPLAPGGPAERARQVLESAGARAILCDATHERAARALAGESASVLRIPAASPGAARRELALGAGDDLAYLLYTSGSTGAPKGVAYDHGAASLFPAWARERFALRPGDRVGAVAPLHFDLSTFDLFAALGAGATVVVPPHEALLFPATLARWLIEREITVLYAVPSLWAGLVRHGRLAEGALCSLRAILFAGEAFPPEPLAALSRLAPGAILENLYGPTETNVCTAYRLPRAPREDDPPLPIGDPLPFFAAALEAPDAHGVGELVIEGPGVMRGYWGTELAAPGDRRRYATGDYASWREDGALAFHGRRDRMVKVRGHRVELGEVEHALARCAGVREAAVIAIERDGELALRAFYVGDPDLGARALRTALADRVPAYMLPGEIVGVSALPRTSTGKIALTELGSIAPPPAPPRPRAAAPLKGTGR